MQGLPQGVIPNLNVLGFSDEGVVQLRWPPETFGEVDHAHRHVFHQDLQVELALSAAQLRMHLTGFGVDEPCLQYLAVAGEQRVGQRAVTPEDAVAVQFDQQAGHRVEQARPVCGLIGRQPHEQPAVLPGPLQVAGKQDRGVEAGLCHQSSRAHRGQTEILKPAQDVVFLRGDPRRHLLERPQLVVGLDELDQVAAGGRRRYHAAQHRGRSTPTKAGPTAGSVDPQTARVGAIPVWRMGQRGPVESDGEELLRLVGFWVCARRWSHALRIVRRCAEVSSPAGGEPKNVASRMKYCSGVRPNVTKMSASDPPP